MSSVVQWSGAAPLDSAHHFCVMIWTCDPHTLSFSFPTHEGDNVQPPGSYEDQVR